MLEPMHSLVANYGIVEVYVQVRAEGPMEHMPRASVATPWVSRVGAVAPCKGKSIITMCFRLLPDSNNKKYPPHTPQKKSSFSSSHGKRRLCFRYNMRSEDNPPYHKTKLNFLKKKKMTHRMTLSNVL